MVKVKFKQRAAPVPVDYMIYNKIALIVIALKISSIGNKASILKIQFFIWILKDKNRWILAENLVNSKFSESIEFWGLELACNRAVSYCVSENIISQEGKLYKLESKGMEFYKFLNNEKIFTEEINFLHVIGKKITESQLDKMATWAK